VDASVDVAIVVSIVVYYGVYNLAWFLGCGGVVKVD